MGGCIAHGRDTRSVVENFHLYTDKQFINYLETQHFTKVDDKKNKVKDLSKLNDPINMFSDTILHYAVFHNKIEICKYLLDRGADYKRQNKRKKTPYDLAKAKNLENIIRLIDDKEKRI